VKVVVHLGGFSFKFHNSTVGPDATAISNYPTHYNRLPLVPTSDYFPFLVSKRHTLVDDVIKASKFFLNLISEMTSLIVYVSISLVLLSMTIIYKSKDIHV